MKIKTIRVENFRGFIDQEIPLNSYSCFVGPNGAGKSTVLCALNVFFRERDSSATDTQKLCDEDFHQRHTESPIRITVTFTDLGDAAKEELSDYVRMDELVVTAEATFDESTEVANVRHFGQRLGMAEFREFFDAEKAGAKAPALNEIYSKLQEEHSELANASSKAAKGDALRQYEAENPQKCSLIPSEDNFYGINSTGKLAQFVQWVYVPAVKDAQDEGQEAKNSALGRLISRVVRSRTNFDEDLETLKKDTYDKYKDLLEKNREGLDVLSKSLQTRLESWAHPNVKIDVCWLSDAGKSIQVTPPVAGIQTGDGEFIGSVSRMGHGLQRSYLLALLQELASSESSDSPTLILGCEEPELYQHPPQARHLADVFEQLADKNSQILVTTHSPLFVSGNGFENVRLVRSGGSGRGSNVVHVKFDALCEKIRVARGEDVERKIEGLIAKIHQSLRPHIAEMLFTRVPILVEGLEDASYITTAMHLTGCWDEFRRLGCHIVPVNGKDKLVQPVALAVELNIPAFVLFDSDGDTKREDHRKKHELDNIALIQLLQLAIDPFPAEDVVEANCAVWKSNLGRTVEADCGDKCDEYKEAARQHYAQEGGLEKHDLFIADFLEEAHADGNFPDVLNELCTRILEHAVRVDGSP